MGKSKFIEVKDVLGLGPERLWYYIPGFNGYEISSDGYIRSMKHWRKYPTGILIRTDKSGRYELSDNHNKRVKITGPELQQLAMNNKSKQPFYPRKTYQCDDSSRNHRAFIVRDPEPVHVEKRFMPHFTVIEDDLEAICPIYDLSGRGKYYGR